MQFESGTVEYAIESHIRSTLSVCLPSVDSKAIVVIIADGRADYGAQRVYNAVCTEKLSVQVLIASEYPIDRVPVVRSFRRGTVEAGGYKLRQSYIGHKFRNYADILGSKGTAIMLDYEHAIQETP